MRAGIESLACDLAWKCDPRLIVIHTVIGTCNDNLNAARSIQRRNVTRDGIEKISERLFGRK
jgi:hypothetical protein